MLAFATLLRRTANHVSSNLGIQQEANIQAGRITRSGSTQVKGEWLLTSDTSLRDADGYFWFNGCDDDVIISAGYQIGPDEVEGCIAERSAVSMVAVIGAPDALRGEVVKAFIVPRPDHTPGSALVADIQGYPETRLSGHDYPRIIEFFDGLPMTITGKIMRRELRNRPPTS